MQASTKIHFEYDGGEPTTLQVTEDEGKLKYAFDPELSKEVGKKLGKLLPKVPSTKDSMDYLELTEGILRSSLPGYKPTEVSSEGVLHSTTPLYPEIPVACGLLQRLIQRSLDTGETLDLDRIFQFAMAFTKSGRAISSQMHRVPPMDIIHAVKTILKQAKISPMVVALALSQDNSPE